MERYYELDVVFESLTDVEEGEFSLYAKLKRDVPKVKKISFIKIEELEKKGEKYYVYILGGRRISKEKFYNKEADIELLKLFYDLGEKFKNKSILKKDCDLILKLFKEKKLDEVCAFKKNLGGIGIRMEKGDLILELHNNKVGKDIFDDSILENFEEIENNSFLNLLSSYKLKDNSFLFNFLIYVVDEYSLDISLMKFC